MHVEGTATADGGQGAELLDGKIALAELTYVDADGIPTSLATDGFYEDPGTGDALQRARRGLLESLGRFAPGMLRDDVAVVAVRRRTSNVDEEEGADA